MWIMLAVLAAFGQALSWAFKKKTLQITGLNNSLGAVSFITAGMLLAGLHVIFDQHVVINASFVWATSGVIVLNVIAVSAMYKALDSGMDFGSLMPFMALTSLAVVPIEYFVRGILPQAMQVVGIVSVVGGVIIFSFRPWHKRDLNGILYFGVTMACYSIVPVLMAVAVHASGSGLFSAAVFHLGIAVGFLVLVFITSEQTSWRNMSAQSCYHILLRMITAGVIIAFVENGPATLALQSASASEVFAIKRLMPLFALVIGRWYFKERNITHTMKIGVGLMIAGSAVVIWFQ